MTINISGVSAARQPSVSAPQPAAQQPPRTPAAGIAHAGVQLPPKVDLKFDAEKVHQNLQQALDSLNEQMKQNGRTLSFKMDASAKRPVVTVVNSQTGEVVRQIPDETVLRLAHHMDEALKGMLHNEKS